MQRQILLEELIRRIIDTIAEELEDWRRTSRTTPTSTVSKLQYELQQRQSLNTWSIRTAQSLRILYSILHMFTLSLDTTTSNHTPPYNLLMLDTINEWNNRIMNYRIQYGHQLLTIGKLQRIIYQTKINSAVPNQALTIIHEAIKQYNDGTIDESKLPSLSTPSAALNSFTITSLLQYILGWKLLYLHSLIPSFISIGLHQHHIIFRINSGVAISLTSTGTLNTTNSSLFAITGIYWNGKAIGSLVKNNNSSISNKKDNQLISQPSYTQLRQIQSTLQEFINNKNDTTITVEKQIEQIVSNFNNIICTTELIQLRNVLSFIDNWLYRNNHQQFSTPMTLDPSITWYPKEHKLLVSLWRTSDYITMDNQSMELQNKNILW